MINSGLGTLPKKLANLFVNMSDLKDIRKNNDKINTDVPKK